MIWVLFLWLGMAQATDEAYRLTWDLQVQNQNVGRRILVIKDLEGRFKRRVMEVWTEVNASMMGARFTYRQRLTGHVIGGPASFHSVIEQSGRPKEIQGRRAGAGWQVSIVDKGRARSWTLDADAVDLSTVDLFNPNARTHLTRLQHVRMLSAETGDILEGDIRSMGPTRLHIAGRNVEVQGYALESEDTKATFYFNGDGLLVKYEMYLIGLSMTGTLSKPPPKGKDEFPVALGTGRVEEFNLL